MLKYTQKYFIPIAYPIVGYKVNINSSDSLILPDVTENSVILYSNNNTTCAFTNKKFLAQYPVHNFITIEILNRGYITNKELYEHQEMNEYTNNLYNITKSIYAQNKYTINTNSKVKKRKHIVPFACIFDAYLDKIIIHKQRGPRKLNPQLFVLNTEKNSCDQTCITHIFEIK